MVSSGRFQTWHILIQSKVKGRCVALEAGSSLEIVRPPVVGSLFWRPELEGSVEWRSCYVLFIGWYIYWHDLAVVTSKGHKRWPAGMCPYLYDNGRIQVIKVPLQRVGTTCLCGGRWFNSHQSSLSFGSVCVQSEHQLKIYQVSPHKSPLGIN